MKIIINNVAFDYNIGCKLLKTKYKNEPFGNLDDIWEHIVPMTFKEIATEIKNLEQRRIAIGCLGLDQIVKEVSPTLMKSETLKKQTTWVTPSGEIETKKFNDTYELWKVDGNKWSEGTDARWGADDVFYIRCKDTSTDREYLIWIDATDVARTNNKNGWFSNSTETRNGITPIQAIAWTIQTDIEQGGIDKIVRQGDCILIKMKEGATKGRVRHLTEEEYKGLLVAES
jgi:hypothetical protein